MSEADVGSAGEEALRLLRALRTSSASPPPHRGPTQHSATDEPHRCSTSWCPVCQVADFVRDNPEAIAGVAASAGSMLLALRELVEAATSPKDHS